MQLRLDSTGMVRVHYGANQPLGGTLPSQAEFRTKVRAALQQLTSAPTSQRAGWRRGSRNCTSSSICRR